jgi:sensor domain CHASE-containing protein
MNNPMSPFVVPQPISKPSRLKRFAARPAWLTFFVFVALGGAAVTWHAWTHAAALRKFAQADAQAHCAALQLEFDQALSAAELLGALAKQSGGPLANFQQVATDLLKTRPGVASLELQPGGVTSDIVPVAGHEKSLGFNVLADPVQRHSATSAIQNRVLTVAGPLRTGNGPWELIARVPVFQRRDNRESFWGFVAASLRLPQAVSRARMDELAADGFDYMLFTPAGPGQPKARAFELHGKQPGRAAVQQTVRAQDIEFQLAVQPSGGWYSTTRLLLESAGALLVAALAGLCVNLFESRRAADSALAEVNARISRETTEHKAAAEESRTSKQSIAAAQAEVQRLTTVLQQTEAKLAETQTRLDATLHDTAQFQEAASTKLKQADASAAELQKRFEADTRLLTREQQTKHAELDQARAALEQTRKKLQEVEHRLAAAVLIEKKAVETKEQALAAEQKAVAAEKEAAAAARSQAKEDQAAIADLRSRLESAEQRAAEAAKRIAAFEPVEPEFTEPAEPEPSDYEPLEPNHVDQEPSEPVQEEPEREVAAVVEPVVETKSEEAQPSSNQPEKVPAPPEPKSESKANGKNELNGQTATAPKRKKKRRDDQMDLFEPGAPKEPTASEPAVVSNGPEPRVENVKSARSLAPEAKPARALPPAPPLDPTEFRKAVHQIVPLLTDQDPGAKDCLKDNRSTFRSGFSPEAYVEFENFIKTGDFRAALEDLAKAAKKHSIPL